MWSSKANFVRSDDLWKTNYMLLPRGNRFLFLDRFLFVAVVNKHHENQVNLYVADVADGGKTFKKARPPAAPPPRRPAGPKSIKIQLNYGLTY